MLYSIVVPVFNSEHTLVELCDQIRNAMQDYSFEIILVDDGSTDRSWAVMQDLDGHNLKVFKQDKNKGQSLTTVFGIEQAIGEFIITIDDDLQFDPRDIPGLIRKQKATNADLVYGIPKKRKHSALRKTGSLIASSFSTKGRGSSFRLMKSAIAKKVLGINRNIILDIEFQKNSEVIERVEVDHFPRQYGKSGYGYVKLSRLVFYSLSHLLKAKKNS